ncbi:hypothetical protein PENTCL1PPCAC_29700, partial [Pristionchus entomophagus]
FGRFRRGPSDYDWHYKVRKCGKSALQWAMDICTCVMKGRISMFKKRFVKRSNTFSDRCCTNECSKAEVWDMCGCNN